MFEKQKNYRNRKLLDLAHQVNECQFQIPGVCIGSSYEGCEPAHSNEIMHGKGIGIKAHDYMHVASCAPCHREYDSGAGFSKEQKSELFNKGWPRTMAYYFVNKLIGVING